MKRPILTVLTLAALAASGPFLVAQTEAKDVPPPGPFPHAPKERVMKTVTFLGVETRPVNPTLTEQLGLPDGVGLIVRSVSPASPAAAVLKQHDILTKLNDQLLIETRQLAVLVRGYKEGDEITLTYVRGGKEATAKVKLAKHDVPQAMLHAPLHNQYFFRVPGDGKLMNQPGPAMQHMRSLRMIRQGTAGRADATALNPASSQLVFSDEKGALTVSMQEGVRTLVATDAKGAKVFEGPVTTPEQQQALPADLRERFKQMENLDYSSFGEKGEVNTLALPPLDDAGELVATDPI